MTHGSSPTGLDHEVLTVVKEAWVNACMNFDETSAEQILNQAFAQFSTEIVCTEILQSGLSDVGTLWYQGKASVQQEHFTSELANRRLHSLISAAPQPIRNKAVLVGCPDGENHTFAALLISLLLRYRGWNVVYLGASVPNGKLQETIDQTKPDLVIMTAMRIVTAAALLDTANFLFENNIPVAFGGGVFNHLPSLARRIPGYFLGEHILESVDKIENLLLKPNLPVVSPQESFNLSDVKHKFIENKQQIEIIVTEQLKGTLDQDFSLSELNLTLNFLSQDIIAALSLGDLDIIGANLDWAKRLMQHREIPEDQLEGLLSAVS